jgi:hypothetical protein
MLRARCVSSAGRAFAGDVLAGIYTTEEAHEIKRAKDGDRRPEPARARAEVVQPHPIAELVDDIADAVEAGEMTAEDARGRIWAKREAIDALSDADKGAVWKAIQKAAHAAGCPEQASAWAIQPPPDKGEDSDDIEDAEFTEEVA